MDSSDRSGRHIGWADEKMLLRRLYSRYEPYKGETKLEFIGKETDWARNY